MHRPTVRFFFKWTIITKRHSQLSYRPLLGFSYIIWRVNMVRILFNVQDQLISKHFKRKVSPCSREDKNKTFFFFKKQKVFAKMTSLLFLIYPSVHSKCFRFMSANNWYTNFKHYFRFFMLKTAESIILKRHLKI